MGIDQTRLKPGFEGTIITGVAEPEQLELPDFYLPLSRAATFPWQSHALWFYSQMVRWGHVELSDDHIAQVRASYHPDMLREALAPLGIALPDSNQKIEGTFDTPTPVACCHGTLTLGPNAFFDQIPFDPDALADYIAGQSVNKI